MAENDQHRRVEPRGAVVGTGMLTDPERIQSLEAEKARRERTWRAPPKQGFGDVLSHAPKKRFERVGVYTPSDERMDDEERGPRERQATPAEGPEAPGAVDASQKAGAGETPEAGEKAKARGEAGKGGAAAPAEVSGVRPAPEPVAALEPPRPGPRSALPPDPRMAALHRALDEKKRRPS